MHSAGTNESPCVELRRRLLPSLNGPYLGERRYLCSRPSVYPRPTPTLARHVGLPCASGRCKRAVRAPPPRDPRLGLAKRKGTRLASLLPTRRRGLDRLYRPSGQNGLHPRSLQRLTVCQSTSASLTRRAVPPACSAGVILDPSHRWVSIAWSLPHRPSPAWQGCWGR
jgi:hypothetical protein